MNEKYRNLNDDEIIEQIRGGDDQAIDYLMEKYKNMVRGKAKALFLIGGERDDLIQEGMIGLYKAIRDYNPGKQAAFSTFADLCTTRQIYTAINRSQTQRNQPLNDYLPIDAADETGSKEGGNKLVYEAKWRQNQDPEKLFIDREQLADMEQRLAESLTPMEQEVLAYYLKDYSYERIAGHMNRTPKAIDNAIQRIRKKLRKVMLMKA